MQLPLFKKCCILKDEENGNFLNEKDGARVIVQWRIFPQHMKGPVFNLCTTKRKRQRNSGKNGERKWRGREVYRKNSCRTITRF